LWVSASGLLLLGAFALAYSLYYRFFAELHVDLAFLNFPIFVGEMLLAACLPLMALKWKAEGLRWGRGHAVLACYVAWVLAKALHGYLTWGPLAFRDAALFYYPLFLVVGYALYEPVLFPSRVAAALLGIWAVVILRLPFIEPYLILPTTFLRYYGFSYLALGVILVLKFKRKWMRWAGLGTVLGVFPYQELFVGASAHLLGVVAGFGFLWGCGLWILWKRGWRHIGWIGALTLAVFAGMAVRFADPIQLNALMRVQEVAEAYRQAEAKIAAERPHFTFAAIPPKLYNPKNDTGEISRYVQVYLEGILAELRNVVKAPSAFPEAEERISGLLDQAAARVRQGDTRLEEIKAELKTDVQDILSEAFGQYGASVPQWEEKLSQSAYDVAHAWWVWARNSTGDPYRIAMEQNTFLFRFFVWRDMIREIVRGKAFWGIDFGKPLRLPSIEILGQAQEEWKQVGWISAHNGFLNMIYRGGVAGGLAVLALFLGWLWLVRNSIMTQSLAGLVLASALLYWMVLSAFLVILELPYTAIPFWTLFGMAVGFLKKRHSLETSHVMLEAVEEAKDKTTALLKERPSLWINAAGLLLLGAFALAYSLYFRFFAELHVQLRFLNFPIFVGEILLAVCFALVILKWKVEGSRWGRGHAVLGCYMVWVLARALCGYAAWGPLAFRHAALFYYPLFLVVGYTFYEPALFTSRVAGVLLGVWALVILRPPFIEPYLMLPTTFLRYYGFSYLALGVLLVFKLRRKWVRWVVLGFALGLFPYKELFDGARAHLLGVVAGFGFLWACGLWILWKRRWRHGGWIAVLTLAVFTGMVIRFADAIQFKALAEVQQVAEAYREAEAKIAAERPYFTFIPIPPKLYNPRDTGDLVAETAATVGQTLTTGAKKDISKLLDAAAVEVNQQSDSLETIKQQLIVDVKKILLAKVKAPAVPAVEVKAEPVKAPPVTEEKVDPEVQSRVTRSAEVIADRLNIWVRDEYEEDFIVGVERTNFLFRFFIWRDMLREMFREKAVLGVPFGKPRRSESIEILRMAYGEWSRDGWISAHNSLLNMIYKGGVLGLALVIWIFTMLNAMTKRFLAMQSWTGLILASVVVYWLVISSFLVILELPYTAIPFWTLFGMSLRYATLVSRDNNHVRDIRHSEF
jgi:hypothetical protein